MGGGGERVTFGGQALLGEVANPEFHALASLPFPGSPPGPDQCEVSESRPCIQTPPSRLWFRPFSAFPQPHPDARLTCSR